MMRTIVSIVLGILAAFPAVLPAQTFDTNATVSELSNLIEISKKTLDSDLFYNIGVLYYRMGDRGNAIVNLKRAYLLNPYDVSNKSALYLARSDLGIPEAFYESSPLAKVFLFPFEIFNLNAMAVIGLIVLAAGIIIVSLKVSGLGEKFKFGEKMKKALHNMGIVLTIIGGVYIISSAIRYSYQFDKRQAVVISEADFHQEPAEGEYEINKVIPGVECKVMEYENGYYEIETVDSRRGWVSAESVKLIWER